MFNGKKTMRSWGTISKELDELGRYSDVPNLTKAERAIFSHVLRTAGDEGVCNRGVKSLARITRTHPKYVRYVVARLVRKALLEKMVIPGKESELRPCRKIPWLTDHSGRAGAGVIEEDSQEASWKVVWDRLREMMPGMAPLRYRKLFEQHPAVFERVVEDLEERVKRGRDPRYAADRLPPVQDVVKYFERTWQMFLKANKR
jgi:hypothetical protein